MYYIQSKVDFILKIDFQECTEKIVIIYEGSFSQYVAPIIFRVTFFRLICGLLLEITICKGQTTE